MLGKHKSSIRNSDNESDADIRDAHTRQTVSRGPRAQNDTYTTSRTVSLVGREPRFRCDGRMVEINTSLESPWSTKLKSIAFNLNRGHLDELE